MLRRARAAFWPDPSSALLKRAVGQVYQRYATAPPSFKALLGALLRHEGLRVLQVRRLFWSPVAMTPRWPVPLLATTGQLAWWAELPIPLLEWLADVKGLTGKRTEPKLRHYHYRWVSRRHGRPRLLEVPKAELKALQRRILHKLLEKIPVHDAAHGFRSGRSVLTYVQPHVGRAVVLRFDLRDFFASVSAARVRAIFCTAGYPFNVAQLLTGLCTTRTPEDVEGAEPLAPRWRLLHLPQGAPTSPALANLAAYRLDVRFAALARSLGATYTRYADDLAFSGDQGLARAAARVQVLVATIAAEEGFELNFRKSRLMRQGVRQQLAGVVVNAKTNPRREQYDELKAILYNCVHHGPVSQNRSGHVDFRSQLLGRIAHVTRLNPQRGAKLRQLFERIEWAVSCAES